MVNLNPFMRYDGYYFLMDWWGIDNLRPRSFAMLRYALRRLLLDWKGPPPEIHPRRNTMIMYAVLALSYRLVIYFSIAVAVYYLYSPVPGLILFGVEIWFFTLRPIWIEIRDTLRQRYFMGSILRVMLTLCIIGTLVYVLIIPIPEFERIPCLILYKGTNRVDSPSAGRLSMPMPKSGREVRQGDLITRVSSDDLLRDAEKVRFDLETIKASIDNLGSGGAQGAYRSWLIVEEERLNASLEKYTQAIAQLEIRAPADGFITDINEKLYEGAYLAKGAYLFTIANLKSHELKAYIHERLIGEIGFSDKAKITVHFAGPELPRLSATLKEKSAFPVYSFPNDSLFDIAGGPMLSVQDRAGRKPRDAYFAYTFDVDAIPKWIPHGQPSWVWIRQEPISVVNRIFDKIWKSLTQRGIL
ncbi:MAG: HlyD family efflux transporter periplasmic adaptor subunit [Desulfobacteraceae bacterium]|nr:HlyD family efflux transporter periplasmic adaptor subunit [Desulfobacteraceae bacterium]